jgi:hypothetical protein
LSSILRDWKTGAIVGILYGITGLLSYSSTNIAYPSFVLFWPLYFLAFIISLPFAIVTNDQFIIKFFIPWCGIPLGILVWKGIERICRKNAGQLSSEEGENIGLLIGPRKKEPQIATDTKRRDKVIHAAIPVTGIVIVVILVIFSGLFNPAALFAPKIGTPAGSMTILTPLPNEPKNMTLYHISAKDTDVITIPEENSDHRPLTISPENAPHVAQVILNDYGGLPSDAFFASTQIQYWTPYDNSGKKSEKYPEVAFVEYKRFIDGKSIVGDAAFLIVEISGDGKLYSLRKNWPTVVPETKVDIITASEAVHKMSIGDFIGNRPKCICELYLISTRVGYYKSGDYLEPVWILTVRLSEGEIWDYYVYARPEKHAF